ncbi:hypothetical protein MMC26_002947 [Xylographa opegraphella]|nr:hypothetical protein [Xylographa opegraphella]
MAYKLHRAVIPLTLCLILLTFTSAQTSTVNGQAVYSGTPVATNPNGIPTLIYNCAKLPAICQNVNRRNPLTALGPGQYGTLLGNDHIELNYDTDAARHEARNKDVCPGSWKNTHPCPETNQPYTVPQGSSYNHGGYPPARYNPNNLAPGASGYNKIADSQGGESGMIWTCDEWPPAISAEGGLGQAQTICAPADASCAGAGVLSTRSEQNFQSYAHNTLRQRVAGTTNPTGVFTFHFKTVWDDDPDIPATQIEWYDDTEAEFLDNYQKRSIVPTYLVTDNLFENRTIQSVRHRLTEQEKRILRNRALHTGNASHSLVQQSFDSLDKAPPLAIIDISRTLVQEDAHVSVQFNVNQSHWSSALVDRPFNDHSYSTRGLKGLNTIEAFSKRQNKGQCSAGSPCPDGSCCNNNGGCGYGPENCGHGNCTSQCDATALCGKDSAGGNVSCPLNVCCSYYGYCGTGSDFCESPNPQAPCQQGFGSCQIVSAPSCGGDSANGRSIAYYQVANVRERQCNRITPAQINTTGLTHLNLAFASIDPSTFMVVPGDDADIEIYQQFTSLKSSTLKTWVAIGGWDFNDPGPTETTWSDLASTAASRATFISSLQKFMATYGFQGVDIDWEYPGAPDRDGKVEDKANLVSLLQEMRSAFGTSYGISVTLPSSYWYLRWFDPKAMEPFVDFFGLMTYDLHGPWDAEVKSIGQVVLGQTNIPEIFNWTMPLWYDSVDPSKINMGLAYYGRGYTLTDSSCNHVGCSWSSTSRPGPCTDFAGVMSLEEIQNLIPQLGVEPELLATDMMKQLTWGNQWIGYDDLETIAMKKQWASSHCFGGTMIWSIDLYSGSGSGNTPDGGGSSSPGDPGSGGGQNGGSEGNSSSIVYIDPKIWGEPNPVINCEPPCTFILPPLILSTPTTISFPLYTTSLDVAWSASTGWTSIVETTVITIPPVTTTAIDVWEITVSDTNSATAVVSSFWVTSSVLPPPFKITDNPNPLSSPGVSHPPVTRTITPPPFPYTFTTPETHATSTSHEAAVLPIVTYKPGPPGPICKSGTVSIQPPPPPPSPSPPPNPAPPAPNPATESLHCYNSGAETGRGDAIKALNAFCTYFAGTVLDASDPHSAHTLQGDYGAVCAGALGCFVDIYVSVTVTNGCRFTVDGPDPDQDCGRIIRETIDRCDQSSTRFKQGGTVTSNCAVWDFDPNANW